MSGATDDADKIVRYAVRFSERARRDADFITVS